MNKRKANKRKNKKNKNQTIKFCIVLTILFFVSFSYINGAQNKYIKKLLNDIEAAEEYQQSILNQENDDKYNQCLIEEYSNIDDNEEIIAIKNNLTSFLNNYNISIYYVDPNLNYSYIYNENKVYYAASTIKMLDALYIYTNASAGNLDLDYLVTYKKSNVIDDSEEIKNYAVGSQICLRDLVKYAVTVSDNSAHDMLIDYIGIKNLKNYGQTLGAKYTLVGGDNFGEITVDDSILYLKQLNNFINNDKLGSELKEYFVNSEQNYLKMTEQNILAAEKYGQYGEYYHENGIVYANNPYLISILTTEGNDDYENIIKMVNQKVYELHQKYYEQRKTRCYSSIYE